MKQYYLILVTLVIRLDAMQESSVTKHHRESIKKVVAVDDDRHTGTTSVISLTPSNKMIHSTYAPLGNLIASRYIDPVELSVKHDNKSEIYSLLKDDEEIEPLPRTPGSFESVIDSITTTTGETCILAILKSTREKVIHKYSSSGTLLAQFKVVKRPTLKENR